MPLYAYITSDPNGQTQVDPTQVYPPNFALEETNNTLQVDCAKVCYDAMIALINK